MIGSSLSAALASGLAAGKSSLRKTESCNDRSAPQLARDSGEAKAVEAEEDGRRDYFFGKHTSIGRRPATRKHTGSHVPS